MPVALLRRTCVSALTATLVAASMVLAPATSPASAQEGVPSPTSRPGDQPLNILLLGDSYSAGNGATNDDGEAETYGPAGCFRSRVNWTEKYAAALRDQGRTVTVENRACSGGRAADFITPRALDTASNSTETPSGVTTLEQADAYLGEEDFCNARAFPDEEFWTYEATSVDAETIDYDCTRTLRAQADFVTPEVDIVLFTMGGNDAGFTNIVTQCFILKSGSGCEGTIDTARGLLPEIRQLLLDGVAGIRAAGLRDDAKIVQLGYPYLQTDNDYVAVGLPPYAAGDEVRSLIDDGTDALAGVAVAANAAHPGQMTFVPGIKEAFAGHEPDATTPVGNPDRWVNQVGDGTVTSLWYHPNGLGQSAYAEVVLRGGDYGATPQGDVAEPVTRLFRIRAVQRRVAKGEAVRIRTIVRTSDGSRARGRVFVGAKGSPRVARTRVSPDGRDVVRLKGLRPGPHRIRAIYVSPQGDRQRAGTRVVVRRR